MKIVKFVLLQSALTIILFCALVAYINVIKMAVSHVWSVPIMGAITAVMVIKEVMQCGAEGKKTATQRWRR